MSRFFIVLSALVACSSMAPAVAMINNLRGSASAATAEKVYYEARRHLANDDAPNGIVLTTGDRFIFISLIVILALYFIYTAYSSVTAPRRRVSIQGEKMAREAAAAVAELHEVLKETDDVLKKAVTEMVRNERKEKSWTVSKWWSTYNAKDETTRESIHADRAFRESMVQQKSINVISEIIQAPGRERSGSITRKTMASIPETAVDAEKREPSSSVNPLHTMHEPSIPAVAPPAPFVVPAAPVVDTPAPAVEAPTLPSVAPPVPEAVVDPVFSEEHNVIQNAVESLAPAIEAPALPSVAPPAPEAVIDNAFNAGRNALKKMQPKRN